ncbi:MAG: hypothetical protein JNM76_03285 [Betaproteobacteria bacterium]|nr:hypothetical protein [Betaproteobacteria bacterium]
MKAFKTKSLCAAVLAGIGAAGSMQAGAVNISADNTGQVLLYPYYTVRNGFVTSLTVVNTDQDHTKAVKVRFLEGRNSAEVLDFNLFLSPRDVWTASVVDNGTGAAVFSVDRSCTAPALGNTAATAQPFVNFYYTGQVAGTFNDNGGASLDRTREGYVEVIEMGVVGNNADTAAAPSTAQGNAVATAVKHAATGTPANCAVVRVNGLFPGANDLHQPAGGLIGSGIIINTTTGVEFAYNPVALANFFFDGLVTSNDLYSDPGNLNPDLRNVSPARSDVFIEDGAGGAAVRTVTDWTAAPTSGQAIDAVSAVFMRSAINNEYDVSTGFRTDWVITAPTKRFYVQAASAAAAAAAPTALTVGPFNQTFASATAGAAQSCDTVFPQAYDREEAPYASVAGIQFSPIPVGAPAGTGQLCFESTVLTVVPNGGTAAGSSVFASTSPASLTLPANGAAGAAPQYTAGWISLYPTRGAAASNNGPGQGVAAGTNAVTGIPIAVVTTDALGGLRNVAANHSDAVLRRYRGLPVIGFAAIQAIAGGQGYGGLFPHKFARNIQ